MTLQAQLISLATGAVTYHENREIETPRAASEFRREFEILGAWRGGFAVRLVSLCGPLAVKEDCECVTVN